MFTWTCHITSVNVDADTGKLFFSARMVDQQNQREPAVADFDLDVFPEKSRDNLREGTEFYLMVGDETPPHYRIVVCKTPVLSSEHLQIAEEWAGKALKLFN